MACKQAIDDHKRKCDLLLHQCRTCNLTEDTIDKWDASHRGSALLAVFGSMSNADICKNRGWTSNQSVATKRGIFLIFSSRISLTHIILLHLPYRSRHIPVITRDIFWRVCFFDTITRTTQSTTAMPRLQLRSNDSRLAGSWNAPNWHSNTPRMPRQCHPRRHRSHQCHLHRRRQKNHLNLRSIRSRLGESFSAPNRLFLSMVYFFLSTLYILLSKWILGVITTVSLFCLSSHLYIYLN